MNSLSVQVMIIYCLLCNIYIFSKKNPPRREELTTNIRKSRDWNMHYSIWACSTAERYFSRKLGFSISKNTIQGFRDAYQQEIKRRSKAEDHLLVTELPSKKRGDH